jgi:two-component system CheB/CheR fusion protein
MTTTTLLKDKQVDGQRKLLAILDRQSRQMAHLLDDLLEASRVTQNKIELRRAVAQLGPIAKDAAESMRSVMEQRGLSFTVTIDDAPIPVLGDATRLLQIHANLLSNAAKYTPRGGHVRLIVQRVGDEAVIRVEDDGAGIRRDMLNEVFELFVQSQRTLDRADGGLGLGLTLVRSLVEMHGGTVSASSPGEGAGATFTVRLPVTTIAPESVKPRMLEGGKLATGAKIVIIEDNVDSRDVLCELLGLAGFECHAAGDGAEGLALLERVRPDVAIIDLGLPVIDGFELARRTRNATEQSQPYLIALTGYGQRSDREAALRAGFDEHLVKPVDSTALMRVLGTRSPFGDRMSLTDGLAHDGAG